MVAFVENLESTDWHLSSHSIGRTHPHRPGKVLAKTSYTKGLSLPIHTTLLNQYTGLMYMAKPRKSKECDFNDTYVCVHMPVAYVTVLYVCA